MVCKVGLDEFVASKACPAQKIVLVMVASRIIDHLYKPVTVRNISNGIATSSLGFDLGLDENINEEFYKDMDWLLFRQERIEKKLAKKHLKDGILVL